MNNYLELIHISTCLVATEVFFICVKCIDIVLNKLRSFNIIQEWRSNEVIKDNFFEKNWKIVVSSFFWCGDINVPKIQVYLFLIPQR